MDLCVIGDFAWDMIIRPDGELRRGGDVFGDVTLMAGGSAANVAVWAARRGARTHFIGKVGDDPMGELARDDLDREGVSHSLAVTPNRRTGAIAVLLAPDGERSMVSGFGADFYLEPDEVPVEVIASARHLHVTGWSLFHDPPRSAALLALRTARDAGATLSLDPASFQVLEEQGAAEFLELTAPLGFSLLFPNRDEGEVLTGEREPDRIVRAVGELYGATVVLKLGGDGALVGGADGPLSEVTASAVEVVDATGAGDTLAGATLAAWLSGAAVPEAVKSGVEAASWKVTQLGARPREPEAVG